MAGEAQAAIGALHAAGWTDTAIGRMVGRNSSLIHQIAVGKKPGANLAAPLEALRETGIPGPRSAKQLPPVVLPEASRRTRSSGLPARVRESGNRASSPGGAELLPNGQRRITGSSKAVAKHAASVAQALGGRATEGGTVRVKIAYKGADGRWHTLAQKGGLSPEKLREYAARGGQSWRDALADLIALFYPNGGGTAPAADLETEFYIVRLGAA